MIQQDCGFDRKWLLYSVAILGIASSFAGHGRTLDSGRFDDYCRRSHKATVLPNGKVLIAGGDTNIAELYDPAAGTWTPTGSMLESRQFFTATLLQDGRVLVAGVLTGGGIGVSRIELHTQATGAWTAGTPMNAVRSNHTATLLPDGKVLMAGGGVAIAELYDPATGAWTLFAPKANSRFTHTATLLQNGKVLVAGGGSSGPLPGLNTAEACDPLNRT